MSTKDDSLLRMSASLSSQRLTAQQHYATSYERNRRYAAVRRELAADSRKESAA